MTTVESLFQILEEKGFGCPTKRIHLPSQRIVYSTFNHTFPETLPEEGVPRLQPSENRLKMYFTLETYRIRDDPSLERFRNYIESRREDGRLIIEDNEEEPEPGSWVCYWGTLASNPPRLVEDIWTIPIYTYFTCKEDEKERLEQKVIKKIE